MPKLMELDKGVENARESVVKCLRLKWVLLFSKRIRDISGFFKLTSATVIEHR